MYANGSQTKYTYNPLTYRLERLLTTRNSGADILQDIKYYFDPVGNIVEIQDDAQQTIYFDNAVVHPNAKYHYDAVYRLIKATGREHAYSGQVGYQDANSFTPVPRNNSNELRRYIEQFEYDEVGNIMKMIHRAKSGNWTRGYSYSSTNNYLEKTSLPGDTLSNPATYSHSYSYDAHGNLQDLPHLSGMTWDFLDQLKEVDLGGGGNAYYVYSGGQRVRKVIENGTLVKDRLYLGSNEIYREKISGSLDLERETLHISDDTGRIAIVDTKTYDGGVISSPTNEIRYQLGNHLQSASLELDDTAAVITYEEFHPFGTSSYRLGSSSTEVAQKRYRYVGKEHDDESGMYYYGARYYAAWLGKFTSVDPRKDDYPMWSSFVYAGNMPVTLTDVNGEGPGDPETHEVVSGDTLSEIAAGYEGVSAEDIMAENSELIKDIDHIEVGWNLKIPGQESSTASKPEIKIGEIQLDDSGNKALYVDLGDYVEHNNLEDPDEIAIGVSEILEGLQNIQGYSSIVVGGLDAQVFSNPNYVTPSGYFKSVKDLARFNPQKGTGEIGNMLGYEYVKKWPKEGLHGNTTGGKSLAIRAKYGNAVKGVGRGLGWASMASTAIDLGVKIYNEEAEQEDYIKAGLDVAVTYISMSTGPAGWLIGGAYFLLTMEKPNISYSDMPEKQKAIDRGEVNPVDALKINIGPKPKLKSKYPIYNIPTPRPQPIIKQGRL